MQRDDSSTDEALAMVASSGPDLRNGLTNHAPMVIDALAALGRGAAILPWLERYRCGLLPRPEARARIGDWRSALGRLERVGDWNARFEEELREAPWRDVLGRWTARLAPAFCASAMHGPIRVAHAVRSLEAGDSAPRVRELGDALAYWAACHQTLPGDAHPGGTERPNEAIRGVPIVPEEKRTFDGTIVGALGALAAVPEFAPVASRLDVTADPDRLVSEMTETFARVFLANASDFLSAVVFTHAVTSTSSLRFLLPLLPPQDRRALLAYAWQSGCALLSTFGRSTASAAAEERPGDSALEIAERAIAGGDEHAIKLAEACLREHEIRPSPAYLATARRGAQLLVPPG